MTATTTHLSKLPAHARLWVYPTDRRLTDEEADAIQYKLDAFVQEWAAHGRDLAARAEVVQNHFIILGVDEQQAGASGCSIDSSVRFLRELGSEYKLDLFNRMIFYVEDANGNPQAYHRESFEEAYRQGVLTKESIVFDPLVKTVADLENFRKPLAQSWHARFV